MRTPSNDPDYLARLQDYFHRWRAIPAYDRLCALWRLSSRSAAGKVLARLHEQGFLDRTPDGDWVPTRRFFEKYLATQPVPAGEPAADSGAGLTPVLLDELLAATPSRTLLVTVRGESMRDANIFDGDIVVVERQPTGQAGDIVVALVDGEMTVKRLLRDDRGWLLHAENPAFGDMRPESELALIGVVVGLARRLRRGSG